MPSSFDRKTPHWYILCYTGSNTYAQEKLSSIPNLQFYAPKFFIDHQNSSKHDVWSHRNYCFVYGSQDYIYQLKKDELAKFIFMPSLNKDNVTHPYVSEYDIEQLRKVEQMNGGVIPLILSMEEVIDGDTVEILSGKFKGLTATAVTRSRSKFRETYLVIKNFFTIPLERLIKEDLRFISFSQGSKHYDNFQLSEEDTKLLNQAIKGHYDILTLTPDEKEDNADALNRLIGKCKSISSPTPDTRLRLCVIMAVAYLTLGNNDYSSHYLSLADTLAEKKATKSTRLFYATLRYLCTSFPEHYSELITQKKGYTRSISQSMQMFMETADEVYKTQNIKKVQSASSGLYEGDANTEHWFCISAPKKKTEAIRLFRDQAIPFYAPIVSDKDQKNVLKDHFFVKMTYFALTSLRNQHLSTFSILCQSVGTQKRFYTYSDEDIETFDFVNALDIPNKEIIVYTPDKEYIVFKSQKRTITLGEREVEGHIMSQRQGKKKQEKTLFILRGVAAIAV